MRHVRMFRADSWPFAFAIARPCLLKTQSHHARGRTMIGTIDGGNGTSNAACCALRRGHLFVVNTPDSIISHYTSLAAFLLSCM